MTDNKSNRLMRAPVLDFETGEPKGDVVILYTGGVSPKEAAEWTRFLMEVYSGFLAEKQVKNARNLGNNGYFDYFERMRKERESKFIDISDTLQWKGVPSTPLKFNIQGTDVPSETESLSDAVYKVLADVVETVFRFPINTAMSVYVNCEDEPRPLHPILVSAVQVLWVNCPRGR